MIKVLGAYIEKRRFFTSTTMNSSTLWSSACSRKLVSPLTDFGKAGVVKFDYRGDTIGLGAGLDEAHGQQVVEWIARRAPRSVTEP